MLFHQGEGTCFDIIGFGANHALKTLPLFVELSLWLKAVLGIGPLGSQVFDEHLESHLFNHQLVERILERQPNCLSADPLPINLWPAKSDAQIDRVLGVVEFVEHHLAQKLAGDVVLDGPVATVGHGCTGVQPLENLRPIEPSRGRGETSAFGVGQHLEVWVENIWTKLLEANRRRHHPSILAVRPSQD